MSHYAVAVFSKPDQDIEELLAPYDENMEVEPYIHFTRQEAIDYARTNFRNTENKTDEECWAMCAEYYDQTDENGNIYSTYNPNSKWDWWCVGGRWCGMLNENGDWVDYGRVGDLTFPKDEKLYEEALHWWDVYIDKKYPEEKDNDPPIFKDEYYRERYGDRETYARQISQFSTYAVVTPDGEWHAPGEMGWFAVSTETGEESRDWYDHYKERFLDTADPDWILTIVDCHI